MSDIKPNINNLGYASRFLYSENVIGNLFDINKSLSSSRSKTLQDIKNALNDTTNKDNISKIQDYITYYKNSNGILRQFINYQSNILTNDFFIVPLDVTKFKNQEDMWKKELEVAKYLELLNIKMNIKWINEEVFSYGEVFLYKLETKNSINFLRIPCKFCIILGKDEYFNNIVGIDLTLITKDNLSFFPSEIQNAYTKYKNGTLKTSDLIDRRYYQLSENATAFTLNDWGVKGMPPFAHIIEPLLKLNNIEDVETNNAASDNYKIIHQIIPTDDDGNLLITEDTANIYHQALKGALPYGIGAITSPMEIKSVNLGDSTSKNMDYSTKMKKNIYDVSGFNDELFNGNKSSNEAIAIGSVVDTLLPLKLQGSFCNWINSILKKQSKTKNWKMCFVESSHYNKSKMIQLERENLAVYGSKKKYLATLGFTPLEAMNIIKNEELLEIANMMLPMQTSHTLSSDTIGRPSNADDSTIIKETGDEE